jgi:methyltransferase (TIGR00027 family)
MDPVASTAHWVAAARARESTRTDALFRDPLAAALAGDEGERWMTDVDASAASGYVAVRTRFFDDELLAAARDRGVRQIAILAAGLDARAYRLDWPAGTRLFEVDRPEVLAYKDRVLASAGAQPRCARATLGADLTRRWANQLASIGFRKDEPSAWLVEGLLPYLHEPDVLRLLAQITALSAPGSALALDVPGADPFTVPAFAPHADKMRARGIRMHFTCDEPAALLDAFGWTAHAVAAAELASRWHRPLLTPETEPDPLRSHLVAASRRVDRPHG